MNSLKTVKIILSPLQLHSAFPNRFLISPIDIKVSKGAKIRNRVTIQNGWNNRISYGCVYAQIRSGLGMHLGTYSNHDTVLFLLIVPIKGRFV